MKRWLYSLVIAGSLLGCSDEPTEHDLEREDPARDDDAPLQQVSAPKPTGALGSECTSNADCRGTNARCLTTISLVGVTFPKGFCTSTCKTNAQCGTTGACPLGPMVDLARTFLPDAGAAVAELSTCFLKCTSQSDCRTGYTCSALPPSPLGPANPQKFCQPPLPDGGLALPEGGVPGTDLPGVTRRDAGALPMRDAGTR